MRIKEAAKRTGLTEKTIRYYESVGLVIPDMETKFDRLWRDYSEEHVRLLSAVAVLRRASFRVDEIGELLAAPEKIPETVERVRARAEEDRAEVEKLCARLAQPDLQEAANVPDLAERLRETAEDFDLPTAELSYVPPRRERSVAEPRSLSGSLARRLALLLFLIWLLIAFTALVLLAGYIREQTLPVFSEELEDALAEYDGEGDFALPAPAFTPEGDLEISRLFLGVGGRYVWFRPTGSFPWLQMPELTLHRAFMVLTPGGTIQKSEGFLTYKSMPTPAYLTIYDGFLSLVPSEGVLPTYLSFSTFPLISGSFEARGAAKELTSNVGAAAAFRSGQTPLKLLDGIESGEYDFDARYLRQTAVLRGRWAVNDAGERTAFLLAAYAWSPLGAAARALLPFDLGLLGLLLLLGLALWLALRRSLIRPLAVLTADLSASPLSVSPAEYDYALAYGELQGLTSGYLLRRAMMGAAAPAPRAAEDCPRLSEALENARCKLLPLLLDRGLKPGVEPGADGLVAADPERLEEALLALLRAAMPLALQGPMTLRTLEKEGFLLLEAEVRTRHRLRAGEYAALWESIYRLPLWKNAPGSALRRACAALPGSFCAVRRTGRGLCLTLGLPKTE